MLTRSEKQIMELLWSIDEPLTCLEIIDRCEDKRWKDSYIHIMIRSLLDKGMIRSVVLSLYARTMLENSVLHFLKMSIL